MAFPVEPVPDGAFFAPHHFLYPLYAVLTLYVVKLNDDPDSKPVLIPIGAVVALVGWFHFWPFYPVTGAILALVGVFGVIVGGIVHTDVSDRWRVSVIALGLFALEDWIDHGTGIETPVSVLFSDHIRHLLG